MKKRTPARTKIEWVYTNTARTAAIVREIYVDSGATKRIVLKLRAQTNEDLRVQIEGALTPVYRCIDCQEGHNTVPTVDALRAHLRTHGYNPAKGDPFNRFKTVIGASPSLRLK